MHQILELTKERNAVTTEHLPNTEKLEGDEAIEAPKPELRKFLIVTISRWKKPRESNEVEKKLEKPRQST